MESRIWAASVGSSIYANKYTKLSYIYYPNHVTCQWLLKMCVTRTTLPLVRGLLRKHFVSVGRGNKFVRLLPDVYQNLFRAILRFWLLEIYYFYITNKRLLYLKWASFDATPHSAKVYQHSVFLLVEFALHFANVFSTFYVSYFADYLQFLPELFPTSRPWVLAPQSSRCAQQGSHVSEYLIRRPC